jgi:mannose-6-phosphate isomerase class I
MSELYPLKFESILKEKIWGGTSLVTHYNKKADPELKYGESWEISALSGNISVVSNGFLAGNNLEELIEVYMGDITGDSIYDRFGVEFPLLIKLIEAKEDLSIQVHPATNKPGKNIRLTEKQRCGIFLKMKRTPGYIPDSGKHAAGRNLWQLLIQVNLQNC